MSAVVAPEAPDAPGAAETEAGAEADDVAADGADDAGAEAAADADGEAEGELEPHAATTMAMAASEAVRWRERVCTGLRTSWVVDGDVTARRRVGAR